MTNAISYQEAVAQTQAALVRKAEICDQYMQHTALNFCTNCASVESPGFYTGCMYKDGHECHGYVCDGKGMLLKPVEVKVNRG